MFSRINCNNDCVSVHSSKYPKWNLEKFLQVQWRTWFYASWTGLFFSFYQIFQRFKALIVQCTSFENLFNMQKSIFPKSKNRDFPDLSLFHTTFWKEKLFRDVLLPYLFIFRHINFFFWRLIKQGFPHKRLEVALCGKI